MNGNIKGILIQTGDRQGSVMAIALMVMVTLTIVGLMVINDTVMEGSVARNHRLYRETLYLAEAAVREGAQTLEDYSDDNALRDRLIDPLHPSSPAWLHPKNYVINNNVWANLDFRGDGGAVNYGDFQPSLLANGNRNACGFLAVFEGEAKGESMGMSMSGTTVKKYEYTLFGRAVGPMDRDQTRAIVKVGYLIQVLM